MAIAGALAESPRVGKRAGQTLGQACRHRSVPGRAVPPHEGALIAPTQFLAEKPSNHLAAAIPAFLRMFVQVLLLDELTTFLDYEDQLNVLQCVRRIVDGGRRLLDGGDDSIDSCGNSAEGKQNEGVTALWVTHRLEELDYADAVSVMEGGRIVLTGSPAQARAHLRALGAAV